MSESNATIAESAGQQKIMWARIGNGAWFVIPAGMAESFRKSGADVCNTLQHQAEPLGE